jgi:hypothetical protein
VSQLFLFTHEQKSFSFFSAQLARRGRRQISLLSLAALSAFATAATALSFHGVGNAGSAPGFATAPAAPLGSCTVVIVGQGAVHGAKDQHTDKRYQCRYEEDFLNHGLFPFLK